MQADLLDRLLVTLSVRLRAFSICSIQRGWRLNFDPFDAVTIHYVLRGTGSLRVEDGQWLPFTPHSILVVPVRRSHAMGEAGDALGVARGEDHCALHGDGLVTFRAGDGTPDTLFVCGQISASYEGALGLFELFQAPMVESFPSHSALHACFDAMMAEVATPSLGTQAMTELLMKQCLIVLLRRQLSCHDAESPMLRALQEPRLARAVVAVLENPGASYSVESLASLAHMSRTAFAERFSHVFGQGPMDFVQRVRLRIAARLLTATDLPVKVIAASVGYASRSAFSRSFEATYGAAPSDYRSFGGHDEAEPERIEDPAVRPAARGPTPSALPPEALVLDRPHKVAARPDLSIMRDPG